MSQVNELSYYMVLSKYSAKLQFSQENIMMNLSFGYGNPANPAGIDPAGTV